MPSRVSTHRDRALRLLRERGLLRPRELAALGIPRSTLQRLVAEGEVERLGRGLYSLPAHLQTEHQSLLEVATRVPGGVICLLSALGFHGIGSQLPHQVWIAIAAKARTPVVPQVALRVVRFSGGSLRYGVETHRIEGVEVKITSPAKTVADCFKYRNKVGLDVALEALKEGQRDRRFTTDELWRAAEVCRVQTVIRPYLEALA